MGLDPMTIVVNPRAGRGAAARALPAVRAVLDAAAARYEVVETAGPGDGTALAREAVLKGARLVVAVGGDGTVHEVVNGMMGDDAPLDRDAALGVVGTGTGCDFARTFGLPDDAEAAARHLLGETLWGRLDVGRVRFRGFDGAEHARWFVNVAEAGIGAQVVVSASRMPKWLGGRVYRLAALKGILTYRRTRAVVRMNGRKARARVGSPLGAVEHEAVVTLLVVANCQFFGGGLRVAPRAIPSDAMLDVLIGEGGKLEALSAMQRMPRGEHVPSKAIAEYLADRIAVESAEPIMVEADGEPLGTTPATFDLIPEAIPLKI